MLIATRRLCLAAAVVLAWRGAVQAQTLTEADRMTRIALIRQAREALAAGQSERALELALRADQIGVTAATRLLLAEVRARLGQHVGALSAAELCLADVLHDAQTTAANREAIRLRCEALREEARGHVGMVRVEVPSGGEGVEVRVGEEVLRPAAWGVPRPVNAGEVVVRVTVANAPPWERRVVVSVGREEVVRVEIPRAEPPRVEVPPTRTETPPALHVTRAPPQLDRPGPAARAGGTQRVLAFTAGGVGLALLAGGVVASGLYGATLDDYESRRCVDAMPDDTCRALYSRFDTLNAAQWGTYIAGGALLVTGVVLYLTAPRAAPARSAFACAPGPGMGSLLCEGRF